MKEPLNQIPDDWKGLTTEFFSRPAPLVAEELLTCVLLRKIDQGWIGGPICETEAYTEEDEASHTFRGMTESNASMFAQPGTQYVYRSYGIHWCLNFSTGRKGRGEGVLIRALAASFGTDLMIPGASPLVTKLCSGPGRLCAALQIDKRLDGQIVGEGQLALWQTHLKEDYARAIGHRIGISKAVDKDWRFGLAAHPSLSKPFAPLTKTQKKRKKPKS
ncbi:MAG: DNA-3-methyladenine glycosylase [Chitinophagaceae bacterium]|nr:DNA-3-methyladenine glycosylase [Oligoflexus sp.]